MAHSILCRLAYLVTPKPELSRTLELDECTDHEICRPVSVITPVRDYEDAFEGWKRAWMAKAKQDFVSEFVSTWSDEFPEFTALLQPTESFDRWWSMSKIDVIEIDSAWKPS
jgi:hypothetical protein